MSKFVIEITVEYEDNSGFGGDYTDAKIIEELEAEIHSAGRQGRLNLNDGQARIMTSIEVKARSLRKPILGPIDVRIIASDVDLVVAVKRMEDIGGSDLPMLVAEFELLACMVEAWEAEHHRLPMGDLNMVIAYKKHELGVPLNPTDQENWNKLND